MHKRQIKEDLPVHLVRRYLEPGPVVLVSSYWQGQMNIMTLGWHCVMEFTPSLIGCMISEGNYSHYLIRSSGECVINIPTADIAEKVVGIGNSTGAEIDKFKIFKLTADTAQKVKAPLIREAYASFECKLFDKTLVKRRNFFVFEVVKAHVIATQTAPQTLHYKGDGLFMVSGKTIDLSSQFRPEML
ncbi:hypothetical protein CUZ56_00310 [Saezia sanguinis]|uniref:Flavin reductase like domain-containing protein n=1 Tax=Saezia sanguinis TaxID=1965230 RepID=A0A433SGJ9_9BURK|nr:flavin reductase family protein [Saezia sanguinis]RUS67830.1 hypothetical protein CUZ56_00310 [Saezia sanguinis]